MDTDLKLQKKLSLQWELLEVAVKNRDSNMARLMLRKVLILENEQLEPIIEKTS